MQFPRLKSIFPPMPQGDGIIRLGANDYGLAAEIQDDEQGHIWRLLHLLDGTLRLADLVSAMGDVTADEVEAALTALAEAGYLEDAVVQPPAIFSVAEVERYRRNFDFFNYFHQPPLTKYDFQARLKESRVTVLGLGGLGSYVALSLAAIGVGDLLLVDHDRVEPSNLNRQVLYTEQDLGAFKCDAAARRLAEINPHVGIAVRNMRVDGVADARAIMAGRNLLVCAADRPRIRIYEWINEAALAERVAWIRGANDGLTVNSFLHVPYETACFECGQLESVRAYPWYERMKRHAMDVIADRTVNPCISPVAGLIGHLTAFEAVKFLTGAARPAIHGHKLTFDLQTLETRVQPSARLADCPACGRERHAER
ncbi:MAG TPA: ThiF family adenylyltransferase [Symbiobacteriaceae bacterium]|nr:ThiF family adenylyltransferase [Symbiobacteriaceae bacterium]